MKNKNVSSLISEKNQNHKWRITFTVLLVSALMIIVSGFTLLSEKDFQRNQTSNEKKLDLLKKLESGNTIGPEEIRSFFDSRQSEFYARDLPDLPDIDDLPGIPEFPSFHGSFYYLDSHYRKSAAISDEALREYRQRLSKSVEELRKNIDSFRNSEEFIRMQDNLRKWSDDFKREIEKMREEIILN